MNPLIIATLQPMLAKLDVLHLLSVMTGDDQPSESEFNVLQLAKRLLSAPIAGDFAWGKAVDFLTAKGMDALALTYLAKGIVAHELPVGVPSDVTTAKPAFQALLDAILNHADIPQLAAVSECPNCRYVYGVMK